MRSEAQFIGIDAPLGAPRLTEPDSAEPIVAPLVTGSPQMLERISEVQAVIEFGTADAERLRSLRDVVGPSLAGVVDRFYETLSATPSMSNVLDGGRKQLQRLRRHLHLWLESLFDGVYDEGHWQRAFAIGSVHVRVGLPQRHMLAAMEVVRQALTAIIRKADVPDADAKLDSLQKLLTIELTAVLESFQSNYTQLIRETERSAMHERLTQAEHLAQIGQLAASLAHEIKNPLAGISGAIQVIRDGSPADDPHRPILGEILRQINRLDRTVKDLLVYARPTPPRFERCQIERVIDRLMMVLKREPALQRVRLEHRPDPRPLPSVEADENQIEQLLMNLVLNAADASEDSSSVLLTAKPTAEGVYLEVADTGQGMDEQTKQMALEPFYTTKSRGTGLGLPICRRIVEAHDGRLTIRSTTGKGTTVGVLLPHLQPVDRRRSE